MSSARSVATPSNLVATYHYVHPVNSEGVTGISPATFETHLRVIAARYRLVTVHEFVARHHTETGLALITFDDGVRDQYEHAFPVLEALDVPAVFYVPMRPYAPEMENASAQRWVTQHLLHALAERLGWSDLERRVTALVGASDIDVTHMDDLYHYEVPEKRRLKYLLAFALPAAQSARVLGAVNDAVGLRAEDWFMTVEQLRDLQDAGHALGGHGFDHVPYSTLSPRAQAADMQRAVVTMNERCGAMPRTLAVPFGRTSPVTETIARSVGYTHTFTTANRVDAMHVLDVVPAADEVAAAGALP